MKKALTPTTSTVHVPLHPSSLGLSMPRLLTWTAAVTLCPVLSLLSLACKASTNLLQRVLDGAARALSERARGMMFLLLVATPRPLCLSPQHSTCLGIDSGGAGLTGTYPYFSCPMTAGPPPSNHHRHRAQRLLRPPSIRSNSAHVILARLANPLGGSPSLC